MNFCKHVMAVAFVASMNACGGGGYWTSTVSSLVEPTSPAYGKFVSFYLGISTNNGRDTGFGYDAKLVRLVHH